MALTDIPPDHWDFGYWAKHLVRLKPGLAIGGPDNPYLLRWYLLPRNPYFNLYLHKFLRSDDDRALHNHPWWFASLVLKGSYWEHRDGKLLNGRSLRQSGSVAIRRPSAFHRVELERNDFDAFGIPRPFSKGERPAWTLFATGPRVQEWGFKCPKGFVDWRIFTRQNGCGE